MRHGDRIAKAIRAQAQRSASAHATGRTKIGVVTSVDPLTITPFGGSIPLPEEAFLFTNLAMLTKDNWEEGYSILLSMVDGDTYVVHDVLDVGTDITFGGITDHGALTGLADDDHPQYLNNTRGDARYWQLTTDLATQVEFDAHVNDASDAHDASAISSVPAGTLAATDVQAALNELDTEKATTGSVSAVASDLAAHLADTSDAHDASAISLLDAANDFTATDVEGALAELQSDHEADAQALADHLADTSDAHDASAISILDAAGDFTATDVEGALAELQSDHEADAQALADHIADTSAAHAASAISVDSTTLVGTGTDVQAVFEEIDNAIADHLADTSDAHDASAISILDAANDFAATDVEGALAELQSDHEADAQALADHIADTADAHDASAISYGGGTGMSATDVEAAVDELATEKLDKTGGTLTGGLIIDETSGDSEITLDANTTNEARINFTDDGLAGFSLSFDATNGVLNLERAGTVVFAANETTGVVDFNETPTKDGGAIWHAGNDGAGSGLDADTLDGVQGAGYALVDHDAAHVRGGSDEIDGDEIDIDFSPTNYLPTAGTPGAHVETVAAHLRGIDAILADATGTVNICVMYRAAAQTHDSGTGTYDQVSLDTEETDTNSMGDVANNRIVITEAGEYVLSGQVAFAANATGMRFVAIRVNGSDVAEAGVPASTGGFNSPNVTKAVTLAVGDVITLHGWQSSGGNLALQVGADATFLSAAKVAPIIPAVGMPNACTVYRSAAQTHDSGTGTYDQIEFDTTEFDTNGLADLVNDRITIVEDGDYLVIGQVGFASNATGNRFTCVRVNGTDAIEHGGPAASGTTTQQACAKILRLVAGDDITLHGFQTSGGNLAFAVNPDLTFLSVALINPVDATNQHPCRASLYLANSGAPTHTSNGGWQHVGAGGGTDTWVAEYDLRDSGLAAQVDTTTGTANITIRKAGIYMVTASILFNALGDQIQYGVAIGLNGTENVRDLRRQSAASGQSALATVAAPMVLDVGDVLTLRAFQNESVSEAYSTATTYLNRLTATYIGPSN